MRLIHPNSYDAGMVRKVEDYKWSSFLVYLGLVNKPKCLYFTYTLSQISEKDFYNEFLHFTYDMMEILVS